MASLIGEDSRKLALDISDAPDDAVAPDAGAAVVVVLVVIDLSSTLGSGSGEKETNFIQELCLSFFLNLFSKLLFQFC
jgi:hypothetical protein